MRIYKDRWDDILAMPYTAADLSDPRKFVRIPFPYAAWRKPSDRFHDIDEIGTFGYQGRHSFKTILGTINGMRERDAHKSAYINGFLGEGRSFQLAAVVSLLRKEGYRVLYVPDCKELVLELLETIRCVFYISFANNDPGSSVSGSHSLCLLCSKIEYLLYSGEPSIDGLNALSAREWGEEAWFHSERMTTRRHPSLDFGTTSVS